MRVHCSLLSVWHWWPCRGDLVNWASTSLEAEKSSRVKGGRTHGFGLTWAEVARVPVSLCRKRWPRGGTTRCPFLCLHWRRQGTDTSGHVGPEHGTHVFLSRMPHPSTPRHCKFATSWGTSNHSSLSRTTHQTSSHQNPPPRPRTKAKATRSGGAATASWKWYQRSKEQTIITGGRGFKKESEAPSFQPFCPFWCLALSWCNCPGDGVLGCQNVTRGCENNRKFNSFHFHSNTNFKTNKSRKVSLLLGRDFLKSTQEKKTTRRNSTSCQVNTRLPKAQGQEPRAPLWGLRATSPRH